MSQGGARSRRVASMETARSSSESSESPVVKESGNSEQTPAVTDDMISRLKADPNASLKYISLVLLAVQNAALVLVMRYVRTRGGDMFMATSAVVMAELLKFSACLLVIFYQEGFSLLRWARHLNENIFQQPLDCLKISVPSVVYTLQNNLLYVAVSNLEAATFQVTYQLKILTTALLSVFMLGKELTKQQWIALFLLFVGVSTVQLQTATGGTTATNQNKWLGLTAVIISCCMSAFAGVYFEKILKGTKQTLWLRNVQLGFLGMITGYITMLLNDGETLKEKGFFVGYDYVVWIVIFLQSFGGLMVAMVVKYADNILKGFATSAAIIISCVASIYLFNFKLTLQFTLGAGLVVLSVYIYSKFVPQSKPVSSKVTSEKV